ncbi:holo-ACP synthase [Garciella nitratireducens]|uniref:Holo-[acyl-carrier-protein] synthase n=1 Tax=Garciella nitratireducens DSM 15102 TaxID=1121911 RepID=A0A1T4NPP3_9FIRM|nr:holo-ACP synthase [Garciella nitratireducens]RBP44789.1 holo-[acyl-carrier-protein] synthase [Garciella nitratireducens]SJZ81172.1 holo-[acyl-carrier-protein] synthase [Garciella nitratireducens DSM 15102]
MILGTGIDIIEIQRISRVVNRRKNFMIRFFTSGEREYFYNNGKKRIESIAGYYAAKEAIAKSMGTGFSGFGWQEIEIKKLEKGQPQVFLWGKAKEEARKREIDHILLSISHCKEYAVAQAIAIGEKK